MRARLSNTVLDVTAGSTGTSTLLTGVRCALFTQKPVPRDYEFELLVSRHRCDRGIGLKSRPFERGGC